MKTETFQQDSSALHTKKPEVRCKSLCASRFVFHPFSLFWHGWYLIKLALQVIVAKSNILMISVKEASSFNPTIKACYAKFEMFNDICTRNDSKAAPSAF